MSSRSKAPPANEVNRPDYRDALRASGVMESLAAFDPHVAGTPPLGLDLPASDIDILCHAPDAARFAGQLWVRLSAHDGFALHQWRGDGRAVIATFHAHGWDFEVFGAAEPVAKQAGWRHFVIERRLLAIGGQRLRDAVMALRHRGLKTEPAFAKVLRLTGDPYAALLSIENLPDANLREMTDPLAQP